MQEFIAAGATLCCSRPIADGELPKSRQVGQSGKAVYCMQALRCHGHLRIYPAHAGMKHVPTIVAVNTDPNASIFNIVKYGMVADIFDIQEAMASQMG